MNTTDDIIDFDSEMFFRYVSVSPSRANNDSLFHYTSISGLNGIFEKTSHIKLWFTHFAYLNDTSEGKEIETFYKQACSCLQKNNKISNEFFEAIKDVGIQDVEIFAKNNGDDYIPYVAGYKLFVCCFSLVGDSLDMWRYYSKGNPGYSLEFSPSLVGGLVNDPMYRNDKNLKFYYFKVIYSNEEKMDKLQELISEAYKLYTDCPNEQEEKKINSIRNYIAYYLKEYQLVFKHECFTSEQEYRIVLLLSQENENKQLDVRYRPSSRGLIPYVEVCVDNANLYLSGVRTSPLQDSLYDDSTKSFLNSKGFSCNVEHSQLPVRF